MSVDLMVFLKRDKLPTRKSWQQAIDSEGLDLKLDDIDTISHTGFWPAKLNGKECGFEYIFDEAEPMNRDEPLSAPSRGWWARLFGTVESPAQEEPDETDQLQGVMGDRDFAATFTIHASNDELQAASIAAAVLAKTTDGVFFDPQSGEFAIGAGAFQLLQDQERRERERKMELAVKKWATTTQRRCPTCGAPCPEYRPTCSVCGYEIGRA
jgi:hypothetical protein